MDKNSTLTVVDERYLPQVRAFGALGYSPERIISLLALPRMESAALLFRISRSGDSYYIAYQNGINIGEYNIDSELQKKAESGDPDSVTLMEERKNKRLELDLRKKLFGV
jgi:hypothetical protein